jgi:hypothetical protein
LLVSPVLCLGADAWRAYIGVAVYQAILIVVLVALFALVVFLVERGQWGPEVRDDEPQTPRWVRDVHDFFVGTPAGPRVGRTDS